MKQIETSAVINLSKIHNKLLSNQAYMKVKSQH